MRETWFVMDDGTLGDPSEVGLDKDGLWRHKDGRLVAMRGPDTPRTSGVDAEAERAKSKPKVRDMKAEDPKGKGYKTRESKAD